MESMDNFRERFEALEQLSESIGEIPPGKISRLHRESQYGVICPKPQKGIFRGMRIFGSSTPNRGAVKL
jgi:hypothetical protein